MIGCTISFLQFFFKIIVMLQMCKSKYTTGKSSSSPAHYLSLLLHVALYRLFWLFCIRCSFLTGDSLFISVRWDRLVSWWTSKSLDFSLLRTPINSESIRPPTLFYRDLCDASNSHRCRWPYLWKQCSSSVQHPPRPTLLLCWSQNR